MIELDLIIEEEAWASVPLRAIADKIVAAIDTLNVAKRRLGEAAVLLTDDLAVQDLNRQFRHKDAPTNVLSFPAVPLPARGGAPDSLGDMALAYGTMAREAAEKGWSEADYTAHLLTHGLLHLLGYDHIADDEAEVMEELERQILAEIGCPDPYADRDFPG